MISLNGKSVKSCLFHPPSSKMCQLGPGNIHGELEALQKLRNELRSELIAWCGDAFVQFRLRVTFVSENFQFKIFSLFECVSERLFFEKSEVMG